jgi:glutathione S-transferase
MAMFDAGIDFEVREISLRNKPSSMLNLSPKGTVPVLLLPDGRVLEQSLDIMLWAYQMNAVPHRVLWNQDHSAVDVTMETWFKLNDNVFKKLLDAYKYPERYPAQSQEETLLKALDQYLDPIEKTLLDSSYILGDHLSMVDIALFPFVRQFMRTNEEKFMELNLQSINRWIKLFQSSEIFNLSMVKYPIWQESQ